MTIKSNRAASKAWMEGRRQRDQDEKDLAEIRAKLDVIGPFRQFVLRSTAPPDLLTRIDDWVEDLTGHRGYFHSRDSRHDTPPIALPRDRKPQ